MNELIAPEKSQLNFRTSDDLNFAPAIKIHYRKQFNPNTIATHPILDLGDYNSLSLLLFHLWHGNL